MANTLQHNVVSVVAAKLYLNEDLADVHFLFNIGDEVFQPTKRIWRLWVRYFIPCFSDHCQQLPEKGDVKIVDARADEFKEFLQFFYLDEVKLSMENIQTVVTLADKYDVLDYVNASAGLLKSLLTLKMKCTYYFYFFFNF